MLRKSTFFLPGRVRCKQTNNSCAQPDGHGYYLFAQILLAWAEGPGWRTRLLALCHQKGDCFSFQMHFEIFCPYYIVAKVKSRVHFSVWCSR